MSLVQTYLDDNGYDYYGNAAEDTLVFFVQDASAPEPDETGGETNETITNLSGDTVNGISGGLSPETAAANAETHVTTYQENGKDTSTNFSISRDNTPAADSEYSDTPVSGSLATPGSNGNADDFSDSVPKMAEMDSKQTDTEHSTDAGFKA